MEKPQTRRRVYTQSHEGDAVPRVVCERGERRLSPTFDGSVDSSDAPNGAAKNVRMHRLRHRKRERGRRGGKTAAGVVDGRRTRPRRVRPQRHHHERIHAEN